MRAVLALRRWLAGLELREPRRLNSWAPASGFASLRLGAIGAHGAGPWRRHVATRWPIVTNCFEQEWKVGSGHVSKERRSLSMFSDTKTRARSAKTVKYLARGLIRVSRNLTICGSFSDTSCETARHGDS